jgi:hypothetical protein
MQLAGGNFIQAYLEGTYNYGSLKNNVVFEKYLILGIANSEKAVIYWRTLLLTI